MYKEFKGLPEVLETLQDANNPVMESIKSIMNSKSIVQVMQNCTLTPKEVLYFSSPLLEGLYEAYFAVQLSPCVDACIFPAYEPPETLTAFFIRALNAEKFSLETAQYLFRQGVSIKDVYHRHVHHWGFIEGERLYEFSKTLSIPHWEDIMSILVIYYYNIPSYSLIKYMLNRYKNDTKSRGYKMAVRLNEKYNPDAIIENNPKGPHDTSYTEDKGRVFALCVREKKTGYNLMEDKNSLTFVSLHELSHIASIEFQHETEFWSNFKFILQNAVDSGLYKPIDYSIKPINYCGLDVTYNPLYDKDL